jgi:hypothetical protein
LLRPPAQPLKHAVLDLVQDIAVRIAHRPQPLDEILV